MAIVAGVGSEETSSVNVGEADMPKHAMKLLRVLLVLGGVSVGSHALAGPFDHWWGRHRHRPPTRHPAPEFDPAAAGAVAALLASGGLFIANRRERKR